MRFYINLTDGAVSRDLYDRSTSADGWVTKRGQNAPIEIQFHQDSVPTLLAPGVQILLGIKPANAFDGPYLTSVTGFVTPGSATDFYTAPLPTSTDPINTALGSPDGTTSDDVAAIAQTNCEVEWWPDGPTAAPTKSQTFSIRIENTPNNGSETAPSSTTPYPPPAAIPLNLSPVTQRTGGTSASLDAVVSLGQPIGALVSFSEASSGNLVFFRLATGAAAAGNANQVAPVDYNAGTNNVHWVLVPPVTVGAAGSGAANALSANDASTTNPRTPTAHKSSHAAGGSDALAPADIGAATAAQGALAASAVQPATAPTLSGANFTNVPILALVNSPAGSTAPYLYQPGSVSSGFFGIAPSTTIQGANQTAVGIPAYGGPANLIGGNSPTLGGSANVKGGNAATGGNVFIDVGTSSNSSASPTLNIGTNSTAGAPVAIIFGNAAAPYPITSTFNCTTQLNGSTSVGGKFSLSSQLSAPGSTGSKVFIYAMRGTVRFAAGASSLVVTDGLVSSTSIIVAHGIGAFDATATSFRCTPGGGSFTITANAAATAETPVFFDIVIP